MRRLVILVVAALAVVLIVLGFGLRRVSPGQAVWAREQGTLLRAGDDSEYVTRWAWQPAGDGRVACSLTAASREGARIEVSLDVTFPSGRFTLAAAATPEEGLKQAVEPGLRTRLAALRSPASPSSREERSFIAADIPARLLLAPTEIPVGAVTAALGAPLFISLLKKS